MMREMNLKNMFLMSCGKKKNLSDFLRKKIGFSHFFFLIIQIFYYLTAFL